MRGSITPLSALGPQGDVERQRIRQQFEQGASAHDTLGALCALADRTIQDVYADGLRLCKPAGNRPAFEAGTPGLCLLALGGYGRRLLFPYSDLDILFLFENEKKEQESRALIAEFSRRLWDLGFRVSSAGRTIEECRRIEEDNAEFHLALLDRRFLCGDETLFEKLHTKVLPGSERQARPFLLAQLHKLTQERLHRYGNTIFHLEPNVKESPGGMRDYQAMVWLRQITGDVPESNYNLATEKELAAKAVDFLSAIRCFLHYSNGRNDNTLTYELQAAAAKRSLGVVSGLSMASPGTERSGAAVDELADAAEWMRLYFRHARTLNRQLIARMERKSSPVRSLRERIFGISRSPKVEQPIGKPFVVRDGLIEIVDQNALSDRAVILSLFAEAARSGSALSGKAEREIAYLYSHADGRTKTQPLTWPVFREILGMDYPGVALRSMQRLGVLTEILPEFAIIDSLVVRDFYHRYTVDEHSLRTIEHLQELGEGSDPLGASFAPLWKTVEQRSLLIFAMLLHDVGKGMPIESHVIGSLEALDEAAKRLEIPDEEKAEVHFLIEHHLDMSATMQRRDIFDPATVTAFGETVGTHERLQRLCLLTYADIHAVNPEALTPWKAEMLWQLFVTTSNHFSRTLDRDRFHVSDEMSLLEQVRGHAGNVAKAEIERFLEGFPRRYLAVHSAAEIARHFALYRGLAVEPVQTELNATSHAFSLTLLTADRPALFATISGVLATWGMNIIKAEAFANAAGTVLDTFHFVDLHRTLELNPSERGRFLHRLADLLNGKSPLEPLLKPRVTSARARPPKVAVVTDINFDDTSSLHSTLLEIVTQDHPGLLYEIGSTLARLECNIEVALIDTEGQKAIDVFYLTSQGQKLAAAKQEALRQALEEALA
ncbi:MAG: [protein-PII] uridylyltransferase [Candidatus Acidiferrum sp.]